MAKPIPTAPQIAAINAQVGDLNNQSTSLQESALAQDAIIDRNQKIDDAFKALFAWYNDAIIKRYDAERKAINGTYIASPIVEADILGVSQNPPTGRLVPTPPVSAIVRITEFDGTSYTSNDPSYELIHLTNEEPWITYLQTGVSGTLPTVTINTKTASPLTSLSTTLDVTDSPGPAAFAIGNILTIHNGGADAAVVQVTSVTPTGGSPPPYTFTLGIQVKIPPTGTLATNSTVLAGFAGFNNVERTAKVASNANLQPLMNYCILQLQNALNARLPRIAEQITATANNEDPDGVAAITAAHSNALAAQSFINGYLPGTDISNSGLSSVTTERSNRITYLNGRITAIIAAYTGQTENYFDKRYDIANARGDTVKGTLRALSNAQNVKDVLNGMVASIASTVATLTSILP